MVLSSSATRTPNLGLRLSAFAKQAACWKEKRKKATKEGDFTENFDRVVHILINKRSFESFMCLASCLLIYAAAQGEVRKTVAQSPSSVTGQCLTWWSATDPTGQLHLWLVSQRTAFSTSLALK